MARSPSTSDHPSAQVLDTPTDLGGNATQAIAGEVNKLLADTFALYLKTKNFHWHMSGPHFRHYHPVLDRQPDQLFPTTHALAEHLAQIRSESSPSIRG